MINKAPIWTQNGRYSAEDDRRLIGSLIRTEGVANTNDMVPAVIPNTRQVSIGGGGAFITGDYTNSGGGGVYHVYNEGQAEVQIPTASTQARIDLVVLRIYDSAVSGDENVAKFEVVTGVPSNSPSAPAVPDTSIAIASVRVNAGTTVLQATNVTDSRLIATTNGGVIGGTTAAQRTLLAQSASATNPVLVTDTNSPTQILMSSGGSYFPVGGTHIVANRSQFPVGVQEGTRVYDKSVWREYQLRDGRWKFVAGDGPRVVVGAGKSTVGLTGDRPNKMDLNPILGTYNEWESKSSGDFATYYNVNTGLPPSLSIFRPGKYTLTYRYTVVNRENRKIWFASRISAAGSYGFKLQDEQSTFMYLDAGDGAAIATTATLQVDGTASGDANMMMYPRWSSNGSYGIIDYVLFFKMEYEY